MKRLIRTAADLYPFTLPGTILFFSSLYIMGKGFAASNTTAISVAFFFLVFSLADWGYVFFCSRFMPCDRIVWNSKGAVDSAGFSENRQIITLGGKKPFLFTRYSAHIKGRGKTSGSITPVFSSWHRSDSRGILDFSFSFPYPGTVSGQLGVFLEDMFALTRIRVFSEKLKDFTVIPGINRNVRTDFRDQARDMVKQPRRYEDDEEKYLMREYVPGDLYRDINWKSSGRIDKLVTRISPGGKERSNRLTFIYLGKGYNTGAGKAGKSGSQTWTDLKSGEAKPGKGRHEEFVTGKYFREFFYTYLYHVKGYTGNSEFEIVIDGQKCSAERQQDLYAAGQLLALSAAGSIKLMHDFSYLADIPSGSKACIFAESADVLQAAFKRLEAASVSACFLPLVTSDPSLHAPDHVPAFRSDYLFSAIYLPARFYAGALVPGAFAVNSPGRTRAKGKGGGEALFQAAGVKLRQVSILTGPAAGRTAGYA